MKWSRFSLGSALILAWLPLFAAQAPLELDSGPAQNLLVELYTSEGCSSCPPAEQFLNDFRQRANLWSDYIPLAFHVDYWDYIGWRDRFADPSYSRRQHQYAQLHRSRTVYTPAFFINGESWRPGLFYRALPPLSTHKAGRLTARLTADQVSAYFSPAVPDNTRYILNIALLGTGLSSKIEAGENKGRLASHEFVVLDHQQYPSTTRRWAIRWSPLTTRVRSLSAPGYAVAIWITRADNPLPVQSSGAYLPDDFFAH